METIPVYLYNALAKRGADPTLRGYDKVVERQRKRHYEPAEHAGNELRHDYAQHGFYGRRAEVEAVGIYYLRKWKKTTASFIANITMENAEIVTGVTFMMFFLRRRPST